MDNISHTPSAVRQPRRAWWSWAAAVGLGFVAGWYVAHGQRPDTREALPAEAAVSRDPAAVLVTVEPVAYRPVRRAVEAVGTAYGFEEVTIAARVESRVRKVHRDVADRVRPGELLLEIDPTDYALAVEQAERGLQVELARLGLKEPPAADLDVAKVPAVMQAHTRMENARSRFRRARGLAASRAISGEDVETATADSGSAEAEYANQVLVARAGLATVRLKQTALAIARQQLADTRVCAPTPSGAGTGAVYAVTGRSVSEGTLVRAGTELFRLVIDGTLKLRVPVPERFSAEVRPGQVAEVFTAASDRPLAGTVSRVNPAVDPSARTFEVEVVVPDPRGELKPGGFARASIQTRTDAGAATVPLAALVNFAGITKLFLAEDGRAKAVSVTLGVQTSDWVEVTSPALPRGGLVVVSGQSALADGTPIAVRSAAMSGRRQVAVSVQP